MYQLIKETHSVIAYLVLIALTFAVVNAARGYFKNDKFQKRDRIIFLLAFILSHIQLLLGIANYLLSDKTKNISNIKNSLKISDWRFFTVEHPFMMLIAITLITISFSKMKRMTVDRNKFKTIFVFYGIALVFILIRIPWRIWLLT
ncbi:hypothetical protein [Ichthyobacterium seriolicida]|uniref:50S ribosomal protein L27 n=1 Tax=Ichthyobacterium seriolicida TaxID=242600 RepID=A0A1J1E5W6_9FLAO|nr:hypothetical protein [Ichthyobacterium seriolicida]BAV95452.1 50S ribosomal protein L27 [Ichthyobacterium seriolicida]